MTTSIDIARRIAEVNHPLSRESVHALAEILVCRKYRKGEIVLQAGEVCKAMLFIAVSYTHLTLPTILLV